MVLIELQLVGVSGTKSSSLSTTTTLLISLTALFSLLLSTAMTSLPVPETTGMSKATPSTDKGEETGRVRGSSVTLPPPPPPASLGSDADVGAISILKRVLFLYREWVDFFTLACDKRLALYSRYRRNIREINGVVRVKAGFGARAPSWQFRI